MSFKREGDDWSQLNVLKVSAREERLEQLPLPSEGRETLVLLLWQHLGGAGLEGVRRLDSGCDPFFSL